ncbi:MAG: hypothetical protein QW106_07240, partial [Candidatus Caldarchaeum sp.]
MKTVVSPDICFHASDAQVVVVHRMRFVDVGLGRVFLVVYMFFERWWWYCQPSNTPPSVLVFMSVLCIRAIAAA